MIQEYGAVRTCCRLNWVAILRICIELQGVCITRNEEDGVIWIGDLDAVEDVRYGFDECRGRFLYCVRHLLTLSNMQATEVAALGSGLSPTSELDDASTVRPRRSPSTRILFMHEFAQAPSI